MANRTIDSLPRALVVGNNDLLVMEQSGEAKSITGAVLVDQLLLMVNDHGGIQGITFDETVTDIYMNVIARDGETWRSPNIKGISGDTPEVDKTEYQAGTSYNTPPTGTWTETIPYVSSGQYLWARITWTNSDVTYINARQGIDGTGAVNSVNGRAGDVVLSATEINYATGTTVKSKIDTKADLVNGKVPLSQLPVWDGSIS